MNPAAPVAGGGARRSVLFQLRKSGVMRTLMDCEGADIDEEHTPPSALQENGAAVVASIAWLPPPQMLSLGAARRAVAATACTQNTRAESSRHAQATVAIQQRMIEEVSSLSTRYQHTAAGVTPNPRL